LTGEHRIVPLQDPYYVISDKIKEGRQKVASCGRENKWRNFLVFVREGING